MLLTRLYAVELLLDSSRLIYLTLPTVHIKVRANFCCSEHPIALYCSHVIIINILVVPSSELASSPCQFPRTQIFPLGGHRHMPG